MKAIDSALVYFFKAFTAGGYSTHFSAGAEFQDCVFLVLVQHEQKDGPV